MPLDQLTTISGILYTFLAAVPLGSAFTLLLLIKSAKDFSRTGPQLKDEILKYYPLHLIHALARLVIWTFLISTLFASVGIFIYVCITLITNHSFQWRWATLSGIASITAITTLQFCQHLLHIPASLEASANYRMSRFYPLWRILTPKRLWIVRAILATFCVVIVASTAATLATKNHWPAFYIILGIFGIYAAGWIAALWVREPRPVKAHKNYGADTSQPLPNIIMIGADTLRADRFGNTGYSRPLTPFIDSLIQKGTFFSQCYVPCARTAPSLASLLTGTWPHKHGIRDNFVSIPEATMGNMPALPQILKTAGYSTIAISDWVGADLGKMAFGFQESDLPKDQWNIKYLLRQGPKDIRLFLSLFTHGWFGKKFLPEIHYLAGIPLTSELGRLSRAAISKHAQNGKPFFLNTFMSTTHGPFGSEWPYYTLFSDTHYSGESKFVMSGVTDPFEIIRKQKEGKGSFDVKQILDLYDGCVKSFDDEVAKIVTHLRECGLEKNTILIIYSDHGMEFFERDMWGQGNSVIVDDSSRIPLIIVDPRQAGNGVISDITRSTDVAPTLLALAKLPIPQEMDGISLIPYLQDKNANLNLHAYAETGIWFAKLPGMPHDHILYPELPELLEVPDKISGTLALKPEFKQIIIDAKDRMIRTKQWKLVYQPLKQGPAFQLFDLINDPKCHHNVATSHPEIFEHLKLQLSSWIQPMLRTERQDQQ